MRRQRPELAATTSARDGHFHFLELPAGSYTLTAAMPGGRGRHGSAKARATVRATRAGGLVAGYAELEVPSTRIEGRVLAEDGTPVHLAEVRLTGSPERAVTDADGRFELRGVELGDRTLSVSARGFRSASADVKLSKSGTAKPATVKLAPGS